VGEVTVPSFNITVPDPDEPVTGQIYPEIP